MPYSIPELVVNAKANVIARNKVLDHALEVLRADGACMISNLMDMYKE